MELMECDGRKCSVAEVKGKVMKCETSNRGMVVVYPWQETGLMRVRCTRS